MQHAKPFRDCLFTDETDVILSVRWIRSNSFRKS